MKISKKKLYKPTSDLRQILEVLRHEKFILDCGHLTTFNRVLGSDLIIQNGAELRIVCLDCGY